MLLQGGEPDKPSGIISSVRKRTRARIERILDDVLAGILLLIVAALAPPIGRYAHTAVLDFRADVMTAMNQAPPPFVAASLVYAGASTTNSTPR
jgi:hypothetical protein